MAADDRREWGPFGMGPWKGHEKVFCNVCGWPIYHMWVDREHEPPGVCQDGKTNARSCPIVLDKLMLNAWLRANTGKPPQESMEMLRRVTGLTWDEIEKMSDKTGRGSHSIAEIKAMRAPR